MSDERMIVELDRIEEAWRLSVRDELARHGRQLDALTYLVACIGGSGQIDAGTIRLANAYAERCAYERPRRGQLIKHVVEQAIADLLHAHNEPEPPSPVPPTRLEPCGPALGEIVPGRP